MEKIDSKKGLHLFGEVFVVFLFFIYLMNNSYIIHELFSLFVYIYIYIYIYSYICVYFFITRNSGRLSEIFIMRPEGHSKILSQAYSSVNQGTE